MAKKSRAGFSLGLHLGLSAGRAVPTGFNNKLSMLFDGVNEYVDAGIDDDLNFDRTQPFTVSWWAKNGDSQDIHWARITSVISPGYWCGVRDSGANLWVYVRASDGSQLKSGVPHTNNDGLWHHYCMVYHGDDATLEFYKDGVLGTVDQPGPLTANIKNNSAPLWIGDGPGKQPLGGNIDEWCLYTAALTPAQVLELYNNGGPVADPKAFASGADLLRWFRMGEGVTAPVMIDSSGSVATPPPYRYYRIVVQNTDVGLNNRVQRFQLFDGNTQVSPINMTDNTTPAPFVADASTDVANAHNVFDNSNSSSWGAGNPGTGEWVSIDLGSPKRVTKIRVRSWGANREIAPFDLEGSDDGVSWNLLQTFPNMGSQFDITSAVRPFANMVNMDASNIVEDVP